MLTSIRDSFKYFIPFFVVICSFVFFLYIKSNTKTETHIYHSISNDVNILPKQSLFSEEYFKEGYRAGERFRYINYLSQKYPDLTIAYFNKSVSVKSYADYIRGNFSVSQAGWMNLNKTMFINDDFIKLKEYGFEELDVVTASYHYHTKFNTQ